eukprot:6209890-Pleurochrysis_carterae.AAC.1
MLSIHQSMYKVAIFLVHNSSEEPMFSHAGTRFGNAALRPELGVAGSAKFSIATGAQARLNVIKEASENPNAAETSADAAQEGVGPEGPAPDVTREGVGPAGPTLDPDRGGMVLGLLHTSDGIILEGSQPKPQAEDSASLDVAQPFTGRQMFDELRSFADPFEVKPPRNYKNIPFEEGGPPLSEEQLESIGMDFSKSCDTGHKDQPLLTMEDGTLQPRIDVCLSCSMVWTRNAKVPGTAIHPPTQVRIPTGTSEAILQKAYPIPHKYIQAVRAEIDGLLKAGLIEPGLSNWCSPVMCVIKKDTAKGATGKDIKLKLAVDFRKLNAATELDTGLLGDQRYIGNFP